MSWLILIALAVLVVWAVWSPPAPLSDADKRRMGKRLGGRNDARFGRDKKWWGNGPRFPGVN